MRLAARLRAFLHPVEDLIAPLAERVAALEQRAETEIEREMKWTEMNAQLRRYLGRLDAHAGARPKENGAGAGARADVLAAKFPRGLPPKE